MNIAKEKEKIIEALQTRNEEWLIDAIKKLLAIEPYQPFSDEHKSILMERIESYEKDPGNVISFDEIKSTYRNEGKWL
jgi:hypothetical protein